MNVTFRLIVAAWLLIMGTGPAARAEGPPTPAESLAALKLADPALKIELVASEPDVQSPVAIAWDERGRLYVAEMRDYPAAPAAGRIKRLEDRDGDGRHEQVNLFADNLAYPNGVMPWDGGLLVTSAPDLLYFQDRDGDGRAEVRRVILTGFGEGNQQLRVNSPTWGLDNRVTLANGRSGGAVRRPDDPPSAARPIPRNDLRLDPRTGAFEPIAGFSQFGLPRDDFGDRFPSWNTVPIRHVVLEDNGGRSQRTVADILDLADGGRIFSVAPAQRRFNAETVTFFNATCGPTILRSDGLGPAYRGDAFICEPLTSVVHRRKLVPDGPTYRAVRVEAGREFLASSHPWFRPVNLTTGPDGALYVVDFCRAWVEHPAFVPESQRQSVDFREGFDRGRIWRITRRDDASRGIAASLPRNDTTGLVAALGSPNGWTRDTAQRRLVERQDQTAILPLRGLATTSASNLARIHALWTLDGLGGLDLPMLTHALADSDARVREQAVRLARRGNRAGNLKAELVRLADDADPRVRLQSAVALGSIPGRESLDALARIATRDAGSPWTLEAVTAASGVAPGPLLDAMVATPIWLDPPTDAQANLLAQLAGRIGDTSDAAGLATLAKVIEASPTMPGVLALLEGLVGSNTGQRWFGTQPVSPDGMTMKARLNGALTVALLATMNRNEPVARRARAFRIVLGVHDPAAPELTLDLLAADQPGEVRAAAAQGVARLADPTLLARIFERWDVLTIATRRQLLGSIATSPTLAGRLLDAIERGTIGAVEVDPTTRDALRRLEDGALRLRLADVFPAGPTADRAEVVRRHEPSLALAGHAEVGRTLFEKHCLTCHTRGGMGAKVGPDLLSVAGKPPAELLVAILDPSREAAPDGQAVVVATTTGRTLTGILVEESPERVRLRRAEGLEDILPRGQVEAIRPTGRSLMPDGLEQVLTPRDLADLIAFLRSNGPPATPASGPTPPR